MTKLEQLQDKVKRLERQLADAREDWRTEKLAIEKRKYGVEVGGIVVGNDGKEYRVANIKIASWRGKPWIMANPKKKDGQFSSAVRHLFDNWVPPLATAKE